MSSNVGISRTPQEGNPMPGRASSADQHFRYVGPIRIWAPRAINLCLFLLIAGPAALSQDGTKIYRRIELGAPLGGTCSPTKMNSAGDVIGQASHTGFLYRNFKMIEM